MRHRRSAGLTLLELIISATLSAGVLLAAGSLLDASNKVAQSTNNVGVATHRVNAALGEVAEAIRHGSLATVQRLDGTAFASGGSDTGIKLRRVTGFNGTPTLSAQIAFRLDGTTMELLRTDAPGVESVLARNVTSFSVARTGNLFTLTLAATSGPTDDRKRSATGTIQIAARNP